MSEKKDFIEKQKALLTEWSGQIEQLKKNAKKTQVDASVKVENYIDDLKEKLDDVRFRLEDLRKAADDNWGHLRTNLEGSWKDIRDAFDKVKSRFS